MNTLCTSEDKNFKSDWKRIWKHICRIEIIGRWVVNVHHSQTVRKKLLYIKLSQSNFHQKRCFWILQRKPTNLHVKATKAKHINSVTILSAYLDLDLSMEQSNYKISLNSSIPARFSTSFCALCEETFLNTKICHHAQNHQNHQSHRNHLWSGDFVVNACCPLSIWFFLYQEISNRVKEKRNWFQKWNSYLFQYAKV